MKTGQQILLLIIICICTFFVHLNEFFPDLMESRNFITAREMIQEGNWWNTTMNLEPRLEKPPLPTWLTALSVNYFGGIDSLFALRFPAALSAMFMVFFFFGLIKTLSSEKYLPLIGGAVMATSLLVIQQARTNSWDIYTHVFMVGSIWQLLVSFKTNAFKNLFYAILFMGLSILSKGPVSLFALWIPFLIAYGIGFGFNTLKLNWKKIGLVLLFGLLIGFSWNIIIHITETAASEYVINKETTSWGNRHVRPFYFYLHFPIYIGIWAVFMISALFYKYASALVNRFGNYRFMIFWTLISVLLLSLIPTKKERYLLPALIPMALIVSYVIYSLIKKGEESQLLKWDKVILAIFNIIVGLAAISLPIGLYLVSEKPLDLLSLLSSVFIAILGVSGLYFWLKKKVKFQFINTILLVCVFCLGLIPKSEELFYHYDSFNGLESIQNTEEIKNNNIYTHSAETDPRIVWQIGKPTKPISTIDLSDNSNYPLILISIDTIVNVIPDSILSVREVKYIGRYDFFRKKSKWKARVNIIK